MRDYILAFIILVFITLTLGVPLYFAISEQVECRDSCESRGFPVYELTEKQGCHCGKTIWENVPVEEPCK